LFVVVALFNLFFIAVYFFSHSCNAPQHPALLIGKSKVGKRTKKKKKKKEGHRSARLSSAESPTKSMSPGRKEQGKAKKGLEKKEKKDMGKEEKKKTWREERTRTRNVNPRALLPPTTIITPPHISLPVTHLLGFFGSLPPSSLPART
jgi:hypothetical protein